MHKISLWARAQIFILVIPALIGFAKSPAAAQLCAGDCNGDRAVTINELVVGVGIALGTIPAQNCPPMDVDQSDSVSINELIQAVSNALRGCPVVVATATATASQTATPSSTTSPSSTPTITVTATPTPTVPPPVLAVEINPDRVAPGDSFIVSITVTNRAPIALTDVVVRAQLPTSGTGGVDRNYVTGGGSCAGFSCAAGQQIAWNLGTLPAQSGRSVNFPLSVLTGQSAPPNLSELVTAVTALAAGAPQVAAQASVIVDQTRGLTVALDEDRDPAAPGAALRYTLRFANRGTGLLPAATLQMPVPAGATFVSASDGGSLVAGIVSWPVGDLPPGRSGVRELIVEVSAPAGNLLAAEALLSSGGAAAQAESVARVQAEPALTLSMAAAPDPSSPGEPVSVALTVTNTGPTDLFGVVTTLRVPPEVVGFAAAQSGSGRCAVGPSIGCDVLERVVWALGDLPAGHGVTLSVAPVLVTGQTASPSGTLITFDAEATATDVPEVQARRRVVVLANRPLELELDADPQPAVEGAPIRFRATFANRGTTLLPAAILDIPVPAGTAFESASDGAVPVDGRIAWALGDLPPGASGVKELFVNLGAEATAGQVIAAEAVLSAGAAQARTQASTRFELETPLELLLAVGPDPVEPGEPLQVSMTVTNRGLTTLFEVLAAVRVPSEVAPFAPNFTNGAVFCTTGASFGCDNLERASWGVDDLEPGHSATLTFPVVVLSGQGGPPPGALIVFESDAAANDGTRAEARRSVAVRTERPLDLELDVGPQPVGAGEPLHYRLTFGNRGTEMLAAAELSLRIPAGTAFVSGSDGAGVVDGSVVWTLGDLPPGAAGVREVVLLVDAAAVQGVAIAGEAELLAGGAVARAQTVTHVQDDQPLTLSLAVGPDPVTPGEAQQILVTITNRGLVSLFEVQAALRVPPEVAPWAPAFTVPAGSCRVGASFGCDNLEREIWDIGELEPGQAATLSVPAMVLSGQNGPPPGSVIVFEADAGANDGSRSLARRSVALQAERDIEVELEAEPQPVAVGAELNYVVTFGNRGTGALTNAALQLTLPPETTFQSASDGGAHSGGAVTWPLGDLAAGAGGVREVTVLVDAPSAPGTPLLAQAKLAVDGAQVRADSTTHAENDVPLDLAVTLSPDPVSPGETLQISVGATNNSPLSLFGLGAFVRVPAEVSGFATAATTGGASCRSGPSFGCDNLEPVYWTLGTPEDGLPSGQTATVNLSPPVPMGANAPPAGTVIVFEIGVTANDGTEVLARRSVRVD